MPMKSYCLLFLMLILTIDIFAWRGEGTKESPYLIETAKDLTEFSEYYNYSTEKTILYFKFVNNIDMKGISMKNLNSDVYAHIDGNNKKIFNLVLEKSNGLFRCLNDGSIKDLEIASGYISSESQIGAFAYQMNNSTMENCVNRATVISTGNYSSNVGGLVGAINNSIFKNCTNYGYIVAQGSNVTNVGGISGSADGTLSFEECSNYGTILGGDKVGGVVGNLAADDAIISCFNLGIVSGKKNVGGIVGQTNIPLITENEESGVRFCWNGGEVTGMENVGGLCGISHELTNSCNLGYINCGKESLNIGGLSGEGQALKSYNLGTVNGGSIVGGLIGSIYEINTCFNRGSVNGEKNVGGLAGAMEGTDNLIKNSYSSAKIFANTNFAGIISLVKSGGLINSNMIMNSYWNKDLVNVGGPEDLSPSKFEMTGLSSSDLKKYIINGFVSDDDNTNEGYPIISGLLFSKEPEKSEKSKITVSANEYGKVYPTGDIYLSLDGSISLNIIPDDGYEFVVTVDDVVNKGFDGTLFMPSAVKHNIYIEFRKPSALDDVYGSRFRVYKKNSNIYINAKSGEICNIYNLQGILIDKLTLDGDDFVIKGDELENGILIFVIGGKSFKIIN